MIHKSICIILIITNVIESSLEKGFSQKETHFDLDFKQRLAFVNPITSSRIRREIAEDTKVLKLKTNDLDVEIIPAISSVGSSSVTLQWDATVNSSNLKLMDDIGFEVSYRPFGSIIEREITLLMKTVDNSNSFEVSSNYIIDHLLPNTGYVLCFSIVHSGEHPDADDIETLPKQPEDDEKEEEEVFINNFQATNLLPRDGEEDRFFPSFPTRPFINSGRMPFVNSRILPRTTTERGDPLQEQGNYAYTSTGELIYLPSAKWNPYTRNKREVSSVQEKICQEVITKFLFSSLFSPLNILIATVSFFGLLALVLCLIFSLGKKYKCCLKEKNSDINSEGETGSTTTDLRFSHDNLSLRKELSSKKEQTFEGKLSFNKSAPNLNAKRTPCKCDGKNKLNLSLKKSTDDFHPGYELPPSSTVEVYGYDFPKASNKSSAPLSPAPSSCDFNDQYSDASWEAVSNKYNLDIPVRRNKRSEGNKFITYDEFKAQKYKTMQINRDLDMLRSDLSNGPPSYDTFQRSESVPEDSKDDNMECAKRKQSVGDIIVTGGTLIEVPDGYAKPAKFARPAIQINNDAVLRILIGGEPSYV